MNGKDIFRGTRHIDPAYIAEAEFGTFDLEAFEKEEGLYKKRIHFRRPMLIAAIIALMVMLMGCAVVMGVFADYFESISGQSLTDSQVELLVQEEQLLNQAQTVGEWTVTLRSVLTDGTKGYIICGIAAPEEVDLDDIWKGNSRTSSVEPGNLSDPEAKDILTASVPNPFHSLTYRMVEDGDGASNTKNFVIEINPNFQSHPEPYGPEVDWYIHFADIIRVTEDEEYRQELLNGKYKGQADVMFTSEETENLYKQEVLCAGTWDFTVNFAKDNTDGVQLLEQPTQVKAWDIRSTGSKIDDFEIGLETVTMTSVIAKPLSVTIFYEGNISVSFTSLEDHVYAVMTDGSQIRLDGMGASGTGYTILEPRIPIVLEELDHILLADGTKLYPQQ